MTIKDGAIYPLGFSEGISEGQYQAQYDWVDDDVADAVYHDELNDKIWLPPLSLGEKIGFWRTRYGKVLKIAEMSTAHLGNAIYFFDEWNDHPKIRELREELAKRTP